MSPRRLLLLLPALAAGLFHRPAAAQARTYLIFFAENGAELTERARQIVAQAAAVAVQADAQRIEVGGHADLAEPVDRAQQVSAQRAQAVAAELRRGGVPPARISVAGFGATRPLVQVPKGQREPQNRRVELVIR